MRHTVNNILVYTRPLHFKSIHGENSLQVLSDLQTTIDATSRKLTKHTGEALAMRGGQHVKPVMSAAEKAAARAKAKTGKTQREAWHDSRCKHSCFVLSNTNLSNAQVRTPPAHRTHTVCTPIAR